MKSEQQSNEFTDFNTTIDSNQLNEFLRNLKTEKVENDIDYTSEGHAILTNRPRRTQRRTPQMVSKFELKTIHILLIFE